MGLRLTSAEFSTAAKLRIGAPLLTRDTWCPKCNQVLDHGAVHACSCKGGGDAVVRHNSLRGEPNGELRGLLADDPRRRPGDVFLPAWHGGSTALDFAGPTWGQPLSAMQRRAEPLLYQALMGLNEDLGAEHPDALAVCASLGLCFQLQGQGLKAHLCYRHAVPLLQHWADAKWQHQQTEAPPKRFLGASVLGAASAAQNWAALLCETKPLPLQEASEAEDLYRWALAALHRELGAEHPSSLRVAGNLAQVVQARRPRKHFHLSKCPAEPSGEQVIPGQEEPEREPAVPAPAPKENEVQGPVQEEEALADEEVLLVSWPKDGRRNAWRGKAYDGCIRRRVLSCCPKGEKPGTRNVSRPFMPFPLWPLAAAAVGDDADCGDKSPAANGFHPQPQMQHWRMQAMPDPEVDATMQAFSQWLSEMKARSSSSLNQMMAEMGIIRDGITSNSTDLTEYKRHSISVQQQMQSQLTDLRDKLTSAFSEITSLVKQKTQTDQELMSEIHALQQQLSMKTTELEALKKSYSSTHQQLQNSLIHLQGQLQSTSSEVTATRKQAQAVQDGAQRKMGEVDQSLQRVKAAVDASSRDGNSMAMSIQEDIGKLHEALTGLSSDFLENKRLTQQVQSKLSGQVNQLEEARQRSGTLPDEFSYGGHERYR
ncbi:unnamed protein product [Polarella glacialis]|uniref:Uncharacterized protein n=1 Tax=Polarella glacialis TaxID=89957 RepID=A0A813F4H7_POLGL|nr:unnamed protein product [Polarella glacialis]